LDEKCGFLIKKFSGLLVQEITSAIRNAHCAYEWPPLETTAIMNMKPVSRSRHRLPKNQCGPGPAKIQGR
jgi:hypothetical protein